MVFRLPNTLSLVYQQSTKVLYYISCCSALAGMLCISLIKVSSDYIPSLRTEATYILKTLWVTSTISRS